MNSGVIVPKSLIAVCYDRMRADILSCRIKPGGRLKIQELCEKYEVTVGAVREALSRLTSEGFVLAEPQRGFRAAPVTIADLLDLTHARIEIETLCIRSAINNGDVSWESRILAVSYRLSRTAEREPDDPERLSEIWSQAHAEFHATLVEACDSVWLLRLRTMLYEQSERYRRLSTPLARFARDLNHEHQDIVAAVLARDADAAAEKLGRHLQETTTILLEAIDLDASSD